MPLSDEHVGSKILPKIKIYILTRAELLFNLCYEIPCIQCPICSVDLAEISSHFRFRYYKSLNLRAILWSDEKNWA